MSAAAWNHKAFANRRGPSNNPAANAAAAAAVRRRNTGENEPADGSAEVDASMEETAEGSSLLVRNLPGDVTLNDVDELFRITIGPLTSCRLVHDSKGVFEGIALVDFVSSSGATKAWEMYNGKKIDQKTPLELLLVYPTPPTPPAPTPAPAPRQAAKPKGKPSQPTPTGPSALSSRLPPSKLQNGRPPKPSPSSLSSSSARLAPPPAGSRPRARPLTARLGPPVVSLESRLGPLSLTPFAPAGFGVPPGGPKPGPKAKPVGLKAKSGPGRKKVVPKKRAGPKKTQDGMDGVQRI